MTKEDIMMNQIVSANEPKVVIDCATANDKMGNTPEERELKTLKKRKTKLTPPPPYKRRSQEATRPHSACMHGLHLQIDNQRGTRTSYL